MPKKKQSPRVPSYRRHKPTNQAVVTSDGRDFYLGKVHRSDYPLFQVGGRKRKGNGESGLRTSSDPNSTSGNQTIAGVRTAYATPPER
jgi:hypothetical protein